jgi:hypothetical protein
MIDFKERAALTSTIRHECGHLVVARDLEFPTRDLHISASQGGATIELALSLRSVNEVAHFIERRVQVLYAGSLAESLSRRKKIENSRANQFLLSTASNDFAKIRELVRIRVGLKHPDATDSVFQKELTKIKDRLYNAAAQLVERRASVIIDLAVFFMSEWDAAPQQLGAPPQAFTLSEEKIAAFFSSRSL